MLVPELRSAKRFRFAMLVRIAFSFLSVAAALRMTASEPALDTLAGVFQHAPVQVFDAPGDVTATSKLMHELGARDMPGSIVLSEKRDPARHHAVASCDNFLPSLARIISNPRVQAHAHLVLVIKGRAVEPRKASEAYPQQRKCVGRNCVRRGGLALNAQGIFQQCAQETGACKAGPFANLPPPMPAHVLRLLILQVTPVTCWQRGHRIAVRIGPARAAARRFKCWCALMLAGQCSFWDS